MDPEIKVLLKDIELAIIEINDFLPSGFTFNNFREDIKSRKAVERNVEIIGEAVKRILEKNSDILITNSRKIVDTRNRIIHTYDKISADVIWLIVKNDLPVLEKEIADLLNS